MGEGRCLQRGHDHLVPYPLGLSVGNDFPVGAEDEDGARMVRLVGMVPRIEVHIPGTARLVGQDAEAGILAGAQAYPFRNSKDWRRAAASDAGVSSHIRIRAACGMSRMSAPRRARIRATSGNMLS